MSRVFEKNPKLILLYGGSRTWVTGVNFWWMSGRMWDYPCGWRSQGRKCCQRFISLQRKFPEKNIFISISILIMSQFCTCHDSSAVVACAKLWHDWIIIFHTGTPLNFKRLDYGLTNLVWNGSAVAYSGREHGLRSDRSWSRRCRHTQHHWWASWTLRYCFVPPIGHDGELRKIPVRITASMCRETGWQDPPVPSCQRRFFFFFFARNSTMTESPLSYTFILDRRIVTKLCTCYDSTAVASLWVGERKTIFPWNVDYDLITASEMIPRWFHRSVSNA